MGYIDSSDSSKKPKRSNTHWWRSSFRMKLKILSFNWHEPYLCLLAKTEHEFLIVEPETSSDVIRRWDVKMRAIPDNVRLLSSLEATEILDRGEIDLAVAHNVKDMIWLREFSLPKIMVFHNRLSTEIALSRQAVGRDEYLHKLRPLLDDITPVFISESKRTDWGLQGRVILPGLDIGEYGGYSGEDACALRVGNLMRERDLMMGYESGQTILQGLPGKILGMNPSIADSRLSDGFQDLLEHYRNCRFYLNTTVDGAEDGYNLAMLEAMATGMPVISTANSTSPVVDGINGYVSADLSYLRECAERLLQDQVLAQRLGMQAKQTVRDKFSIQAYLKSWHTVIRDAVMNFLSVSGISMDDHEKAFSEKPRKNILMDYVSYPATTAFYLHRGLKKFNSVVACGAMIGPELIKHWNLEALKWEIAPQDIFRANDMPLKDVIADLPQQWTPDLYLWVETGLGKVPPDLEEHTIPKACYLIDTHINLEEHKRIARRFDYVFLAQRAYVDDFLAAGCQHVFWLPLACDPEIHGQKVCEKLYDVGFVGTVGPAHTRRKKLLDTIDSRFKLQCDRKFMDEMAELYSQSRIVFNNAIRNDLNMRVFEALCSGSLLVTDRISESGLGELFEDKKHLVIYEDELLSETIRYYLDHPQEREEIASAGREEVIRNHTYDHRAKQMIKSIEGVIEQVDSTPVQEDKPDSYYQHVRNDIISMIPESAKCILEIGCAAGMTGKELKKRSGVFVAGVEMDSRSAAQAIKVLDDVSEGNIETLDLPYSPHSFDCILFGDVLEHLVDPLAVLKKLTPLLKADGTVVASLPNVQYFGVVHHLAEGNWTYQKEGILDETHLRFFTYREIEKLFTAAGFDICAVEETLDPQYDKIKQSNSSTLNMGRVSINNLSPEEMRRFFVFQYKVRAALKVSASRHSKDGGRTGSEDAVKEELRLQGRTLEDRQEFAGAINVYCQALEQFPDCPELLADMGNCHMRLGDMDQAGACYEKAVKSSAECHRGWIGLGVIEVQRSKPDDASALFQRALNYQPDDPKALCGMGMACMQRKNFEDARIFLVRALEIDIDNEPALNQLLILSYETGKFDVLEKYLSLFLRVHPANVNALFGLAGVQYKSGRYDEVKSTLDLILVFDPDHKDALELMERIPVKA